MRSIDIPALLVACGLLVSIGPTTAQARVTPTRPHPLSEQLAPLPGRPAAGHARTTEARAAAAPAVLATITRLRRSGSIPQSAASRYRSVYLEAQRALSHLSGTRHTELAAVLQNMLRMQLAGQMTPSRMPEMFLTLQRNREWWSTGSLLSYGARVSFPGSRLVWEYYNGQGIELQWLATFGEANGYYLSGNENEALRQVLDEASGLAVQRAGGIAFDYLFNFDGGSPPWTSGLSQGTAIQAFARASQRLGEPAFTATAEKALGVFQTPPPAGVRLQIAPGAAGTPARVHYLEYSFAPDERILNGFIQSLNGLYDFTKITGSAVGLRLFEEGDADARVETPHYDTGAWSLYDQHSESDLGYHELLAEFLQDLCERTRQGPPIATGGTPVSAKASPHSSAHPAQIAGDQIYCTTATHFYEYLHTPPLISLLSKTLPANAHAGIQLSLSKISTIGVTVTTMGGKTVWTNSATVEAGKPRLLWVTPKGSGIFKVTITATDLAGNHSSAGGQITLTGSAHKSTTKSTS
ncbi:MAG TPA: D-glucuronyl C5-epimerase family protein [Solirubrobacteraceae bacterium]|nr:D-glucuronyl C5-epimerase family protein [Solirubrobacteraceae bacterium]